MNDDNRKYNSTYIAVRLGHELLQLVDQILYFLRVFSDAAQLLLVEFRGDLFAQKYLRDHVADVWWAGSSFWNGSREKKKRRKIFLQSRYFFAFFFFICTQRKNDVFPMENIGRGNKLIRSDDIF